MKDRVTKKFSSKSFFGLLFSFFVTGFAVAQNEIEVYVSSQAGDRLTRKKDATFTSDTKSSLPAITVNEKQSFQTIEGFGATFNEAGMICLNSLSPSDGNNVFTALFDTVKGSGFTMMKSPIAA